MRRRRIPLLLGLLAAAAAAWLVLPLGREGPSPERAPDAAQGRLAAEALDAHLVQLNQELERMRAAGDEAQQVLTRYRLQRALREARDRRAARLETPLASAYAAHLRTEAKTWDAWWNRVFREIERRRAQGEDLEDLEAQLLHIATQREAIREEERELRETDEMGR